MISETNQERNLSFRQFRVIKKIRYWMYKSYILWHFIWKGKKFKDYEDLQPDRHNIDNHYIPRLHEMKRVLKSNGTIYLQMDLRIVHWIRLLMDSIFGYENFRNQIVVKFNIGGRGKREFAKKHDYIIVYTKSDEFVFNDLDIRVPYKSVISKKQDDQTSQKKN